MDDLLIKDALIVTCDGSHSIIENGVMSVSQGKITALEQSDTCLLYTSPSPRDRTRSRMPSSA